MKYFAKYIIRISIFAVPFFGLKMNAAAQSPKFDSLQAVKEIAPENIRYAQALGKANTAAVANCYDRDARIFNDGSPIATEHFYSGMVRHGVTGFSFETVGVRGSDDNLIVEEGTASFALSTGKVVSKGRYLLVRKQANRQPENLPRYLFF